MKTLSRELVPQILQVIDAGLVQGLGVNEPGKMCVEAAICYALDEPHGDKPSCVHEVIRNFKIGINDSHWHSEQSRAKGMRRAAIAQLGSTDINDWGWAGQLQEKIHLQISGPYLQNAKEPLHASLSTEMFAMYNYCWQMNDMSAIRGMCSYLTNSDNIDDATYGRLSRVRNVASALESVEKTHTPEELSTALSAVVRACADTVSTPDVDESVLRLGAELCVEACIAYETEGSQWLDLVPLD